MLIKFIYAILEVTSRSYDIIWSRSKWCSKVSLLCQL